MPEAGDQSPTGGRLGTAVVVALVLAACAFAYAIGSAWAADGGSTAASPSGPAAQPVQQNGDRPREDCPERDGGGSSDGGGSPESSGPTGSDL